MKIGIVTFFRAPNYGAMLQARALWCYLKGRGHEVYFVDHDFGGEHPQPLWRCLVARNVRAVKTKLRQYVRHRCTLFSADSPVAPLDYPFDAVVVGSDQMWNPRWMKPHIPVVFLAFARCKRISYAVSFGVAEWGGNCREEVRGLLAGFEAISVRERSGVEIVRELCGRSAEVMPDPTLLWNASFYEKLLGGRTQADSFVFSFFLDEFASGADADRCERAVSRAIGVKRVRHAYDHGPFPLSLYCRLLKVRRKIGIEEWFSYLSSARFVVTNSFHGTVFSLLFHRPFVVVKHEGSAAGMNDRLLTLLSAFGLEERFVTAEELASEPAFLSAVIDWSAVDGVLEKARGKADRFFGEVGL